MMWTWIEVVMLHLTAAREPTVAGVSARAFTWAARLAIAAFFMIGVQPEAAAQTRSMDFGRVVLSGGAIKVDASSGVVSLYATNRGVESVLARIYCDEIDSMVAAARDSLLAVVPGRARAGETISYEGPKRSSISSELTLIREVRSTGSTYVLQFNDEHVINFVRLRATRPQFEQFLALLTKASKASRTL